MAIITPSTLTKTVQTMYDTAYRDIQDRGRTYDQLAGRFKELNQTRGTSVTVSFLSDAEPSITAGSRTADPTPQTLTEADTVVTTEYYDGSIEAHETSFVESFAFHTTDLSKRVARMKLESVEYLARQVATQAAWKMYPGSNITRASLAAATSTDRMVDSLLLKIKQYSNAWAGNHLADGTLIAILDDFAFGDLASSGNVDDISNYQKAGIELNYELGKVWGVRLVVSPFAKAFYGAGANNATADVDTTLNGAISALATKAVATTIGSLAAGMWVTLGTVEDSTTGYPTTEIVMVDQIDPDGDNASEFSFHGGGANGGCRFAHADGAHLCNNNTVHPVVIGGPYSLGKVFSSEYGEYGESVGPKQTGDLNQFILGGYKWWGGYGRPNPAQIICVECSATYQ